MSDGTLVAPTAQDAGPEFDSPPTSRPTPRGRESDSASE